LRHRSGCHPSHHDDGAIYWQYVRDRNASAFAAAYICFVKAVTEPAFFRWVEPGRSPEQKGKIIDTFYGRLEARIAADPDAATWSVANADVAPRASMKLENETAPKGAVSA
jgi:hypothetical protein